MSKHIPVPCLNQAAAPTGCESVTAVMLLNYLGVKIGINEFIDNYLDKGPMYEKNGLLYAPNPFEYFVGDPYSPDSMGCYAPVIKRSLERLLGDGYEILDETGREIDSLAEEYIDKLDMPIILWATIDLRPAVVGPVWQLPDGEEFTWLSNEHCMLLTGYEDDSYIFNDPRENRGVIKYPKELVRRRHREQGMRAVGVKIKF